MIKGSIVKTTCIVLLTQGSVFTLSAQSVSREREATITGPRGRTIDRRLEVNRGPGTYERQLQIQRPGGTVQRDFMMQRVPRVAGLGAGGFGGRPMVFRAQRVRRASTGNIVVVRVLRCARRGPSVLAASASSSRRRRAAGRRTGRYSAWRGLPLVPPSIPPRSIPLPLRPRDFRAFMPAAVVTERRLWVGSVIPEPSLLSFTHSSMTPSKDVKIAAAQALGQIGGTDSEVVLERCIVYEKKEEVRDAAALALRRLRDRRDAMAASTGSPQPEGRLSPRANGSQTNVPRLPSSSAPPASSQPSPFRNQTRTSEAAAEPEGSAGEAASDADRVPPPPPSPVNPN